MKNIFSLFVILLFPFISFSQDVMFSHGSMINNQVKSQTNINYKFAFKGSKSKTEIEVFFKDNFIKKQIIKNNDTLQLSYAKSLGTTYNSDGKDVFLFYFGNYKKSKIEFYTWDNTKFAEYKHAFKDSSFYKYNSGLKQVITEHLVNLRAEPNTISKVKTVLKLGTEVTISKFKIRQDTINREYGYWTKVIAKNDTGYLWHDFISLKYIDSYKEKSLRFVVRNAHDFKHQIIAIRNNEIVDTFSFRQISHLYGMHSKGSMGLKNVEEIIGVCYSGESCGVPSGDAQIVWDGNKFHKFINEEGTGDGGLSYGVSITYPSSINGKKEKITLTTYDSESIDVYKETKEDESYDNINRFFLSKDYTYKNWELKEVNSETQVLEKLLATKFPTYKLNYYEKGDLNQDGVVDAILYAVDTAGYMKEGYEKKPNKSLLVIAFKSVRRGYFIHSYSNKIIVHEDNSPLTRVVITSDGFKLNIYYSGYYNDESNPRQYFMNYKFDKEINNFRLLKITEYFPPVEYSGNWEKKEYNYKKNIILFKDSYHPDWD